MQGQPQIIEVLNDILRFELTAINQYFLNSRMCQNWYERLAKRHREISMEEMRDSEELIDRILYLQGREPPAAQPPRGRRDPVEQIRLALELEHRGPQPQQRHQPLPRAGRPGDARVPRRHDRR